MLNNLEKVIATVEMKVGKARGVGSHASHAGLGGSHLGAEFEYRGHSPSLRCQENPGLS